jgi:UDP-N-acetylmuramyl pentapeptide synthase
VHTAVDAAEALQIVVDIVEPGDAVLVKASRAMGLEIVAIGLRARTGAASPPKGSPS